MIVGSGPNGLAAAVILAAASLAVQVTEGGPVIGGGCRTDELTLPAKIQGLKTSTEPADRRSMQLRHSAQG